MKQKFNIVAIIIAIVFFVACENSKSKEDKKKVKGEKEEVVKKDCKEVHWSHHKGDEGPENWKNLCDGFSDCGKNLQSPIDIVSKNVIAGKDLVTPKFSYGKTKVDIVNNGHTVQFNVDGENMVNLLGKNYQLLQFHYHALSEHTINGKHFPIEVHFVHKYSDTDFAVLGIMFVEGKENELFRKYLDKFPTTKGEYKSNDVVDLLSLFPEDKSFYHYNGSLTTPPCSEVVSWFVLKNPVEASKEQIRIFSKILKNNYRPVMPLNGREILSLSD